jgi:hypothetical protein
MDSRTYIDQLFEGVPDTPEFRAWFAGSKAVDVQGQPALVYRGEHGESGEFLQSRRASLTFGSADAANLYAQAPNDRKLDTTAARPRVTPAYLSIRKPVINDPTDPFIDLSVLIKAIGWDAAAKVAKKFDYAVTGTNNWDEGFNDEYGDLDTLLKEAPEKLGALYLDAYHVLDDPETVQALKARGFDGAICAGTGETSGEPEYRVFDKIQVWSAYSTAQ